jgi:hypothetical protein
VLIPAYGAEGFVPMSMLPSGYWRFDQARQRLIQGSSQASSKNSSTSLGLGDPLICRIEEIDMLTGNLVLSWHYRNQLSDQ